ncbi:MAG: ATP-binding protein, partial [Pseudomonadota bacterium]
FFVRPGAIAPTASRPVLAAPEVCTSPGLALVVAEDGAAWRVFTISGGDAPPARVCVGQPVEARRALVLAMMLPSLAWWLLVIPITALIVWVGLRRGLSPLAAMAKGLRAREPGDLSPIDAPRETLELQPLLSAMNDLLARQRRLIEQERRFSAEAAHELRTPLATVRLRAEQALAHDTPPDGPLEAIVAETERAERVLNQLLALARVDAADARGALTWARSDLVPLVRQVLAEQASLSLARGVHLELARGDELAAGDLGQVRVDPVLWQLLLRNLVENALRYTPSGGRVQVRLQREADGTCRVDVNDDGPGIPPQRLRRLCEPFERGARHDQAGTGLGLTIARRIAWLHDADLTFAQGDGGRGLRATVTLPPAATDES